MAVTDRCGRENSFLWLIVPSSRPSMLPLDWMVKPPALNAARLPFSSKCLIFARSMMLSIALWYWPLCIWLIAMLVLSFLIMSTAPNDVETLVDASGGIVVKSTFAFVFGLTSCRKIDDLLPRLLPS